MIKVGRAHALKIKGCIINVMVPKIHQPDIKSPPKHLRVGMNLFHPFVIK